MRRFQVMADYWGSSLVLGNLRETHSQAAEGVISFECAGELYLFRN